MIDKDCKYCCSLELKKRDAINAKDITIKYSDICANVLCEQGIATVASNICKVSNKVKNTNLLKAVKCSKYADYCCYVRDIQDNVATITLQPTKTELEIRNRGRPKNEQKD
jgi:hypothetical protein